MARTSHKKEQRSATQKPPTEDLPVEKDPAVERGERINIGKSIARGGKEDGDIAGATEQPPAQNEDDHS
ncbi:MAG: hypothetical protein U0840_08780 [Gemmataceae bacterium]